ncbi:hypothetical protein D3C72_2277930 [compost metagenome]
MRWIMALPQRGQPGTAAGDISVGFGGSAARVGAFAAAGCAADPVGAAARARLTSTESAWPSISSMFRADAKARASAVNCPDVTTNPCAAPCAAITPYSSRTTVTGTL